MTTARLFLSGIRASGRHGANPGEKDEPQEFVVDLDLVVHVDDDAIESTAHYRGVRDAVRGVIVDGSYDLIEVMANEVAERVLAFERVTRVTAVVHKPNAARRLEIDGVAAAVTLPPDPEPVGGIGSPDVATMTETAYLGLGSNLGDRLDTLQRAVELLDAESAIVLARCSRVWETDPVGGPPQPDFLNVVVRAEVGLEPRGLLAACQRVEAALGRVRDVRWGPRTVDIDILLIDALLIDEDDLTVPHPRMHERAFVLMPLLDIEPDITLPNGTRLLDVPLGAGATVDVRPFAPPLRLPHRSP